MLEFEEKNRKSSLKNVYNTPWTVHQGIRVRFLISHRKKEETGPKFCLTTNRPENNFFVAFLMKKLLKKLPQKCKNMRRTF